MSSFSSYIGDFTKLLGEYKENVNVSSWEGPSYDKFKSQTNDFYVEYSSSIKSQMTSFSNACDTYETYEKKKTIRNNLASQLSLITVETKKANAIRTIDELDRQLDPLATKIRSLLDAAADTSFESSSQSYSVTVPNIDSDYVSSYEDVASSSPIHFSSGLGDMANGEKYFQAQGNGENCGMTAFLVGVNTLLGENKYTDNVGEWANYGSYSEAIGWNSGNGQAQRWLNDHGLSDDIEITGVYNVFSREQLCEHLDNGEVVVSSSGGSIPIFKRNDGSKATYAGHYVMFYKGEDGNVYANDSSVGTSNQGAGVLYTDEDLDAFFSSPTTGNHGSLSMKRVA